MAKVCPGQMGDGKRERRLDKTDRTAADHNLNTAVTLEGRVRQVNSFSLVLLKFSFANLKHSYYSMFFGATVLREVLNI